MTDEERTIYELCRFYEDGICHSPETPKFARDCIKEACVVFGGYTCQPEPNKLDPKPRFDAEFYKGAENMGKPKTTDKMEAVKQVLMRGRVYHPEQANEATIIYSFNALFLNEIVSELLKLFPEYEPVGLEALGDEEICAVDIEKHYNFSSNTLDFIAYGKAISQATIQKNQMKGQLYRIRE